MNVRILAIVISVAAICLSLYNILTTPLHYSLEQVLGVALSCGTLLVAYWLCVDYEKREEDLEYQGKRIGELAKCVDAKVIAETSTQTGGLGRKNMWVCPGCKALNSAEERICHHCKNPISQTT